MQQDKWFQRYSMRQVVPENHSTRYSYRKEAAHQIRAILQYARSKNGEQVFPELLRKADHYEKLPSFPKVNSRG